jgi:hypothetical protein
MLDRLRLGIRHIFGCQVAAPIAETLVASPSVLLAASYPARSRQAAALVVTSSGSRSRFFRREIGSCARKDESFRVRAVARELSAENLDPRLVAQPQARRTPTTRKISSLVSLRAAGAANPQTSRSPDLLRKIQGLARRRGQSSDPKRLPRCGGVSLNAATRRRRARLGIRHIFGCQVAAPIAEALVASFGSCWRTSARPRVSQSCRPRF